MKKFLCIILAGLFLSLSHCSCENDEPENCSPNGGVELGDTSKKNNDSWLAFFGGFSEEEFENTEELKDGNLVIVGTTISYSCSDYGDAGVIKLDKNGNLLWAKTLGGGKDDMLIDVVATDDGGFVAVGWTQSFGASGFDAWVVRFSSNGDIVWQNRYGGNKDEQATTVDIADDGSIVFAAGTKSFGSGGADIWVVKLDKNGNILWQMAYGAEGDDAPQDEAYGEFSAGVFFDKSGNVVAGATTNSFGNRVSDVLLLKLNSSDGSIIWQNYYGDDDAEGTWTIKGLSDGNYLIPGILEDPEMDYNESNWIVKVDSNDGSIIWQKKFGIADVTSEPLNANPTSDGGALLAGYYEKGDEDWYSTLIRMDRDGGIKWATQIKKGSLDYFNDALELSDGTIAGSGVYYSEDLAGQIAAYRFPSSGFPATSCSDLKTLNYTVKDTNTTANPAGASATPTDGFVKPTDTSVNNVKMRRDYECHL